MTPQERIKNIVRRSVQNAEEQVLTYCPDNHARRIAQISLQQALRFALLAIDRVETKPRVEVPGR